MMSHPNCEETETRTISLFFGYGSIEATRFMIVYKNITKEIATQQSLANLRQFFCAKEIANIDSAFGFAQKEPSKLLDGRKRELAGSCGFDTFLVRIV